MFLDEAPPQYCESGEAWPAAAKTPVGPTAQRESLSPGSPVWFLGLSLATCPPLTDAVKTAAGMGVVCVTQGSVRPAHKHSSLVPREHVAGLSRMKPDPQVGLG